MANITIDKLGQLGSLNKDGYLVVSDQDPDLHVRVTRKIESQNLYNSFIDNIPQVDTNIEDLQEYLNGNSGEKRFILDTPQKIDYNRLADTILERLKIKQYNFGEQSEDSESTDYRTVIDSIKNLNSKIQTLDGNISIIESKVENLPTDTSDIISLTTFNSAISSLQNSIEEKGNAISELDTMIDTLNNNVNNLTSSFDNYIDKENLKRIYKLDITDLDLSFDAEGTRLTPFQYGVYAIDDINELPTNGLGYVYQKDLERQNIFPGTLGVGYGFVSFGHNRRSRIVLIGRANTTGASSLYARFQYRYDPNSTNDIIKNSTTWSNWKQFSLT